MKIPENISEKIKSLKPVIKISASIGLLIFAIIIIGYYTLFTSRGSFHSDSTDTLMWAQASYDSKVLFLP